MSSPHRLPTLRALSRTLARPPSNTGVSRFRGPSRRSRPTRARMTQNAHSGLPARTRPHRQDSGGWPGQQTAGFGSARESGWDLGDRETRRWSRVPLPAREPGQERYTALPGSFAQARRRCPGGRPEEQTIHLALRPTGTVSGRLVDEQGRPRAHVLLEVSAEGKRNGNPWQYNHGDRVLTAADGTFVITGVIPEIPVPNRCDPGQLPGCRPGRLPQGQEMVAQARRIGELG